MNNQNKTEDISGVLMRVYGVLKMTPEESKAALGDLAGLQQLALSAELLKDLTKDEAEELNEAATTNLT